MRLSLRFVLPLLLVLGLVAYGVTHLVDRLTLRWFVHDLDMRSTLIASTVAESLPDLIQAGQRARVVDLFNRMVQDERLYAIGFCDNQSQLVYKTVTFPPALSCTQLRNLQPGRGRVLRLPQGSLHAAMSPVQDTGGQILGTLVLLHDMSFIERRSEDTRRYVFYLFVGLGAVVSLITVAIAQMSWWGWVRGVRILLSGDWLFKAAGTRAPPELQPVVKDLRALIRGLERERRSRDESQVSWNPEALRTILREDLRGDEMLIVSNREPYIHNRKDGVIQVQRPASGLVTALEPVMLACSGTWIAHGSGSADRDLVDARDHVSVPPERPAYTIRRVWLSQEQEEGYYYGFSNEGLWPLCHIAHTRPVFRPPDWERYVEVNSKFAATVVEEADTPDPVILVQDYHFALLPAMIRRDLPEATIIAFWHIPWPNPEAFGICPWAEQILAGMLGSSILGFHTRFHCNNFLDTVDRFLEARVDRETNTVSYQGARTAVKRYPISIEWPPSAVAGLPAVDACRERVRRRHGLEANLKIVLGIDRLDYTKGILERFLAVERLLEVEPAWTGRVVFIQIGAPSRSRIPEYRDFAERVEQEAARINQRFARDHYQPIVLRLEHVDAPEVYTYYRAADACMVSSLHDGMNLVAKEFAAARDDEQGVLILSEFTGAARELVEALIINPYDMDQCASALRMALTMQPREQRDRMRSMRGLIQEFNVYRWAGRMLLDASVMRRRTLMLGSGRVGDAREEPLSRSLRGDRVL
ncbi:MAG TPA: trehalose-6-phosphate synthase [Burkholderiales bacterium]|nr:trehalose-6-phosphate synthase [Burkholderiales bacterium]